MITNRLKKLATAPTDEQERIISEIKELVTHLYVRYRESQQKLNEIRVIINR
ncbi:hypothetical protein N752_17280 [Desulforamulus aquiferis]|nr:hypothetical protein [Desulforamulus aquiferis]RYD03840.1 hypothetical protein N752_17280 [Desulforamulus aquiferis]